MPSPFQQYKEDQQKAFDKGLAAAKELLNKAESYFGSYHISQEDYEGIKNKNWIATVDNIGDVHIEEHFKKVSLFEFLMVTEIVIAEKIANPKLKIEDIVYESKIDSLIDFEPIQLIYEKHVELKIKAQELATLFHQAANSIPEEILEYLLKKQL